MISAVITKRLWLVIAFGDECSETGEAGILGRTNRCKPASIFALCYANRSRKACHQLFSTFWFSLL